ncbi:hypothetical protein TNCV_2141481 [Trichonephila clavipes]|uniref:Uncharacterized protein n=1 Tax=Trichonephila clavipes TaxID=2585209 RepID=A0A8X6S2C4_TRICX|nr:hypothetical protein TNCV_2141481 [Trichonephila clavipes]
MDVCKCVLSLRHEGTINTRRAASPLVRLVEEEERWETSDQPQGVLPQNWETMLPVRLINATNEWRLVQGHETPLRVKGDIEDVSSELEKGIKVALLG